jgi:hypothetical protein
LLLASSVLKMKLPRKVENGLISPIFLGAGFGGVIFRTLVDGLARHRWNVRLMLRCQ